MTQTYNRRTILAGLGAVGAVALGSRAVLGAQPPYTHFTYAQTDGESQRLSVSWYETYNGEFQEAQGGSSESNVTTVTDPAQEPLYVDQASGPILTLGNIMPGDAGSVVIGLLAESVPTEDAGMDVWFRPVLTSNLENGVNEPESHAAGEDDDGSGTSDGELADALEVVLYRDDGFVGGCDGKLWPTDTVLASGSMATSFDSLAAGVNLTDGRCLAEGERRCLGFTWRLPSTTGNHVQSDSVTFDLAFEGVSCGETPQLRRSTA